MIHSYANLSLCLLACALLSLFVGVCVARTRPFFCAFTLLYHPHSYASPSTKVAIQDFDLMIKLGEGYADTSCGSGIGCNTCDDVTITMYKRASAGMCALKLPTSAWADNDIPPNTRPHAPAHTPCTASQKSRLRVLGAWVSAP